MSEAGTLRLAGLAAIGGGLLRVLAVLIATTKIPDASLQQVYFAIDFLLLLGAFGVYGKDAAKLGWIGVAGLALFVFGILVVRSPQVSFFGIHGYQSGAAIALLGVTAIGAMMLARHVARLAPLLWLAALVAGACAATGLMIGLATALAGLFFGAGFVAAGLRLARAT